MFAKLIKAIPYLFNPEPTATTRQLPPHFSSENHRQRCLAQLRSKETGLERYIYLNGLKDREPHLFYELLLANMMVCSITHFYGVGFDTLDVGNSSHTVYVSPLQMSTLPDAHPCIMQANCNKFYLTNYSSV
jgi:hypothetical protein